MPADSNAYRQYDDYFANEVTANVIAHHKRQQPDTPPQPLELSIKNIRIHPERNTTIDQVAMDLHVRLDNLMQTTGMTFAVTLTLKINGELREIFYAGGQPNPNRLLTST